MENINLKYDGKVNISIGKSRMSATWTNKVVSLSELYTRFSRTRYTGETVEEYKNMIKKAQDEVKDVGGFFKTLLRKVLSYEDKREECMRRNHYCCS